MMTNAQRADLVRAPLAAFAAAAQVSDEDLKTQIQDMIVDLLHLARLEAGVDDVLGFVVDRVSMHDEEMETDQ